jgi:hypothetical protein
MCSGDAIGDAGAPSVTAAAAAGHSQPPPLHQPPPPSANPAAPSFGGDDPESSPLRDGGGPVPSRVPIAGRIGPGQVFQNYVLAHFSSLVSFSPQLPLISGEI